MSDPEATNTALALAGATHALLAELLVMLVDKGVMTAPDALQVVQRTRSKLEAPGQPGGIRASVYLEPIEQDIQARMPG